MMLGDQSALDDTERIMKTDTREQFNLINSYFKIDKCIR